MWLHITFCTVPGLCQLTFEIANVSADGHSQLMLDGSPSSGPQTERQLPPGPGRGRPRGSGNKRQRLHAEHAVTWTDAAVSALQV